LWRYAKQATETPSEVKRATTNPMIAAVVAGCNPTLKDLGARDGERDRVGAAVRQ
jgi:hypothetical protein